MVMVGQFYTRDALQNWFLNEGLPAAREVLNHFDTLNSFFHGFKDYEKKNYKQTRNVVLMSCLPDLLKEKVLPEDIKKLHELEEALLAFDVPNWQRDKLNHLRSRLCSDGYYTSFSAYTELVIARRLANKVGTDNIEIYPGLATGKESDVLVNLVGKRIYLEIGNLGESEPEKKIQKIIDAVAKHLGNKLKESWYLMIEIDTAQLVFDKEGRIDKDESVKKLEWEIDRLCLDKLAGFKGFMFPDEIAWVVGSQESLQKMYSFLTPDIRERLQFIGTSPVKEWIDSCKHEIVQGSKLIKSIIGGGSKTLLVEVHTESIFPSAAAEAERNSFINHVKRHLEDQLQQLEPNNPNITIVQAFNWTIFGFGINFQDIAPLYLSIKKFLDEKNEESLSGIALFSRDFSESVFISNEEAGTVSKLRRDEIDMLGVRYLG